jgi:hypothetical protein
MFTINQTVIVRNASSKREETALGWNLRMMESGVGWRIYVTKG